MTRIHMDTDETRNLARRINRQVGEIDEQVDLLRRAKARLNSAWSGGNRSARFMTRFNVIISNLEKKNHELDILAVRLHREVDQWLEVDSNFGIIKRYPLPVKEKGPGLLIPPNNWKFFPINKIDLKILDGSDEAYKWTPKKGWKEDSGDPKISIGVAVPVIGGNLAEGEAHIPSKEFGFIPASYTAEYELGEYEAGIKAGLDPKKMEGSLGLFAGGTVAKGSVSKTVGTAVFGFTTGVAASVGEVEGFAGITEDGIGASIGASAASIEVSQGINIAGINIGVSAGISAGVEAGIVVGPQTKVKVGPFRVGLQFGKAIV